MKLLLGRELQTRVWTETLLYYDAGTAAGQIPELSFSLISTLKTLQIDILQWLLGKPAECVQYHNAAKSKVKNDVYRAPGVEVGHNSRIPESWDWMES